MGLSLPSLTKPRKDNPSRQDFHETLRQNRLTDVREGNQVMKRVRVVVTAKGILCDMFFEAVGTNL